MSRRNQKDPHSVVIFCILCITEGILKCYCPGIDGDRRLLRITVRHLLQHSGGWDFDVIGDPIYYRHVGHETGTDDPVDRHTLVTYMLNKKLQFNPGISSILLAF